MTEGVLGFPLQKLALVLCGKTLAQGKQDAGQTAQSLTVLHTSLGEKLGLSLTLTGCV